MQIREYFIAFAATAVFGFGLYVGKQSEREPCFRVMSDATIMEPFVLGYEDSKYGWVFKAMDRQNGNLVTTEYGVDIFVPSDCYLDESGFMPTLWRKKESESLFSFEGSATINRIELSAILQKDLDFIMAPTGVK